MSKPDQSKGGFSFQWHITDVCNLTCAHCYRNEEDVAEVGLEELFLIADNLMNSALHLRVAPSIGITGGEPLARPDLLFGLLDYLRDQYYGKLDFSVDLMTNGVLLTAEYARKLADYYPMVNASQISLDGGTPEVNDAIRGPGAFAGAVLGAEQLMGNSKIRVSLSYTFHRGNVDDLPEFLDVAEDLNVHGLHVTRLVPIGRGQELQDKNDKPLSPYEVRDTLTMLYERAMEYERMVKQGIHKPHLLLARGLFHLVDPQEAIRRYKDGPMHSRLGNACAVGSNTVTILSDGTMLLCRRMPIPVTNLLEQKLNHVWLTDDTVWKYRLRAKHIKGKCQRCEFLREYPGICSGGAACIAHGMNGSAFTPDPQCWYVPTGT